MIRTRGLTRHFTVKKETGRGRPRPRPAASTQGELVALLGPNGAGKSTTLRMLTTLLPPTSGTAEVAGYDVATDPRDVRARIGYIGQGNGAGHSQRGRDELISQGRCYGLSVRAARARAAELIDSLDLSGVADRVVSSLSGGQRRRLDIALGLIHAPDLLFLDEPSTGLDPQNRANLHAHLRRLRAEHGTTIVLTTHYLDEADPLAERVIVIDHGQLIADDTPTRLKADHAGDRVSLTFDREGDADRAVPRLLGLAAGAQVERVRRPAWLSWSTVALSSRRSCCAGLDDEGITVASVEVARPTLDDVFLNLTGRSLRDEGTAAPTSPTPTGPSRPVRRFEQRGERRMTTTLLSDTVTVFSRELRPVIRDPFSVIFTMVQPLVFLALFAPLLPTVVRRRLGAAVVRPRDHRDVVPVRYVDDRCQPAVRDPDRVARTDAGDPTPASGADHRAGSEGDRADVRPGGDPGGRDPAVRVSPQPGRRRCSAS